MIKSAVLKGLNLFKNPLIPLSVLAGIVIIFIILPPWDFTQQAQNTGQVKAEQIFETNDAQAFSAITRQIGPRQAYELIKSKFKNNEAAAHDFAHIIGIVAHEEGGMANLKICDTAYNYGCYHGFIEDFIAKNTVSEVSQIEDGCIALGWVHAPSCLHGIGHGVMVDASYNLDKALNNCSLLQESSQIYCWDGVFMERIVGSMLSSKDKLKLTDGTLNEPCRSVAATYRQQCWRNQPAAWLAYFKNDIRRTGDQCLAIDLKFQDICLASTGHLIAMGAPNDANQIKNLCTFGGGINDACLIGVVKELMFEGKPPQLAQSLCAYSTSQADCLNQFNQLFGEYQQRFGGR